MGNEVVSVKDLKREEDAIKSIDKLKYVISEENSNGNS